MPQTIPNMAQMLSMLQMVADKSSPLNRSLNPGMGTEGGGAIGTGGGGRTFYRGENPGDARRIETGNKGWDSHLFVADNPQAASMYGKNLSRYEAAPNAKILREGTREFLSVAGKWRKGENMLDYSARAAEAAKAAGYDAVWFKRQGDVGTAILNPAAFKKIDGE
jgi:hypothetical protein